MFSLIRRDEVFQSLQLWMVKGGLTAGLMLGVLMLAGSTRQLAISPMQMIVLVVWLVLGLYLVLGNVRRRSGPFDMALPQSAGRLWVAHVTAVTLSCAGLVALAVAILGIHDWAVGKLPRPVVLEVDFGALAVVLFSGAVAAVVLIESREVALNELARDRRDALWRTTVVVGIAAITLVLSAYPFVAALVLLALAAAVGWWTYQRLPATFALLPRQAEIDVGPASDAGTQVSGWTEPAPSLRGSGLVRKIFVIVHGCRWGALTPWITYSWVLLAGAFAGGLFGMLPDLADLRVMYLPLYVYFLFIPVPAAMEQLSHLDPLPVSRRVLFALLVVPSVVFFVLGWGIGQLSLSTFGPEGDAIVLRRIGDEERYTLMVPIGRTEIAWDGEVPSTTSRWGESHEAWSVPLFRGSRVRLYSLYTTPEGSSLEFVALQMSRAVEGVYDRSIPATELATRYLEVRDGVVRPIEGGLTLVADYPDLEPRTAGPMFAVFLTLIVVPFLLLVGLYQRAYRPGATDRTKKAIWGGVTVAAIGSMAGFVVLAMVDFWQPLAVRGFLEILVRKIGEVPGGSAMAWIVLLVLGAGAYGVVAKAFGRSELPAKPTVTKLL